MPTPQARPRPLVARRTAGVGLYLALLVGTPAAAAPWGASNNDTSMYALGSYVHNVVFLQDDLLRDPDDIARPVDPTGTLAHWTTAQLDQQRAYILEAADFWVNQPLNQGYHPAAQLNITVNFVNGGLPLTVADIGGAGDTSAYDDALAQLDPAYANLGAAQATFAFNHDTRAAFGADWAWTSFVRPYEPRTASAQLNGPNINAFLDSNTYIHAHEAAHIFGALDQYAPHRTDARGGYLDVFNPNAELLPDSSPNPDHVETIMSTFGLFNLSGDTIEQIGWRDTDGDTIPDILDTQPRVFPLNLVGDLDAGTLTGTLQSLVTPFESPRTFVSNATINTLNYAEFRFNGGVWTTLLPNDGAFGDGFEAFTLDFVDVPVLTFAGDDYFSFDFRLVNTVGNATVYSQTFGVPEPATLLPLLMLGVSRRRRPAATDAPKLRA